MRLVYALIAFLAISRADEEVSLDLIDDSEAVASVELLKTAAVDNSAAASSYVPPSQRPPRGYPQQISQQNNWALPGQNTWTPPSNTWTPPQNTWTPPENTWKPPENVWNPPQNTWTPPQNTWTPPQNTWNPPSIPQKPWGQNPQQDESSNTWSSTTPTAIIKNEQYYGDNGSYKYEYQIADGTHVGEEGYVLNPRTENESLVKKGWYSYMGSDGKTYTVTWWADETGFHASGDHLPKPPPVPPAIQAAIEQNAKEEAAKAEAEKNKPQATYPQYPTYPQQQQTYPQQQQTYPQQQQTYPQQQQTYPQQQQTYPQQQQTYPQQQQTYPQQQQTYPQQQQTYAQQQPTYYPNQQSGYYNYNQKRR